MNIGKKLWKQIETAQGYAFISDQVEELPDEVVLKIAKGALKHAKRVVRILERFIEKYEVK